MTTTLISRSDDQRLHRIERRNTETTSP
jgi:predicted DNA repair protein MutK